MPRWTALALAALLAACGGGGGSRASSSASSSTTPTTRPLANPIITTPTAKDPADYLSKALDVIEDNGYYSSRVDWPTVRIEASKRAAGATSFAATYPAIQYALQTLGDHHSRLATPQAVEESSGGLLPEGVPEVRRIDSSLSEIKVTVFNGPPDSPGARRYVEAAESGMEQSSPACGWIVDLRGNNGGNLVQFLLAVGPLLGDGNAVGIRNRSGNTQRFTYEKGRVGFDGKDAPGPVNRLTPLAPKPAVALLTDAVTASSSEFLLLSFRGRPDTRSFGAATAGVPTANDSFSLTDGAVLILTIGVGQDLTGRTYEGPITPDAVMDPASAETAAAQWLRAQPPCKR